MIKTFVEFAQALEDGKEIEVLKHNGVTWEPHRNAKRVDQILNVIDENRLRVKPEPNTITCYMHRNRFYKDQIQISSDKYMMNSEVIKTWEEEIPEC